MNKDYRLTKEGVEALKAEVEGLIGSRIGIAEKLKIAREHGDLKENAEYHNARDEQATMEARIGEIESILKSVEIVKVPTGNDHVELGNTVILKGIKGDQAYTIVGSVEANPTQAKISDMSPIGQALLGKKVGEEVTISLPSGDKTYMIKTIK